ncbi:DNA/RNA non-specific endonuclease [Sphingobacterium corticibacter]|uniref:DNA/RNA non-specific endonuclease n=1 Tax=Sphingobacterium corticibacter TaxID=2171749 RepID=UPI0013FD565D|nr:DNA/RNA non-specific endonuclease [Sphingobacterium corticibacter]
MSCKDTILSTSEGIITEPRNVRPGPIAGPDAQPSSGENSNLYLGNPSNAQSSVVFNTNYLIDLKYYTISYNANRGTPNWVSWYLDRNSMATNVSRQDNFAGYSGLPANWYTVLTTSYTNSGFDRGHNCPSADRLSSIAANSSVFLMVNMIPQAPRNNQGVWNNFENYLRTRVNQGNEIYIIMGSYGRGGTGTNGGALTIDQGRVTVPSNVYKIAVILPVGANDLLRIENGQAEIIAIDTPNLNTVEANWQDYRVTIRELESKTGYNFLSTLSSGAQNRLKNVLSNAA